MNDHGAFRMPPIRYPLPTLLLLLLVGLLVWRGEVMTRPIRSALAARYRRATEGPAFPSSTQPQRVAGAITRRVLLLRDGVAATSVPGGPTAETIRTRMFSDVYDVWPTSGEPQYVRVGNRRAIGWVRASDVLPWNTRLVVHLEIAEDQHAVANPVLSWDQTTVRVAVWPVDGPWGDAIAEERGLPWSDLPAGRWGVWMSREELLELLRHSTHVGSGESSDVLRIRGAIGRVLDDRPMTAGEVSAAKDFLPALVFKESARGGRAAERLARINEQWETEATWGGMSFRFVPLTALP